MITFNYRTSQRKSQVASLPNPLDAPDPQTVSALSDADYETRWAAAREAHEASVAKWEPTEDEGEQVNERLITVQREQEYDLASGTWDERVFVKLYVAARTSGLLAAIPPEDWHTLTVVATYMDKDGKCRAGLAELARAMGVHRSTVSDRIASLESFQFNGLPIFLADRPRDPKTGRFAGNEYTVMPGVPLKIFDN
jgi:hypothetical protein